MARHWRRGSTGNTCSLAANLGEPAGESSSRTWAADAFVDTTHRDAPNGNAADRNAANTTQGHAVVRPAEVHLDHASDFQVGLHFLGGNVHCLVSFSQFTDGVFQPGKAHL